MPERRVRNFGHGLSSGGQSWGPRLRRAISCGNCPPAVMGFYDPAVLFDVQPASWPGSSGLDQA
ncbi:hypothetical protein [Amycolatopsis pithecellobii]|uniref:hypothetical protein n=1 Tax=Amycolatopsis pithecellobii TaxID=664692 RepID=UPI001AA09DA8|nr:hypothetical protein [Amycolatopsis pithecellobii]